MVERDVGLVAHIFGIGCFAEHDDRDVRLGAERAVSRERCGAAGGLGFGLDALIERGRAGEVAGAIVIALPRERPAARLHRHIVRALASDEDAGARLDRQERAVVLEQHERFLHRLARHRAMLGCADRLEGVRPILGAGLGHDAGAELDAQHAAHRVVEARHRDLARLHLADHVVVERLPVGRHVEHVDTRVERDRAVGQRAARDLRMGVPVADDQAVEAHARLQYIRHQRLVGVHLGAVPAAVGRHDRLRARVDGGDIAGRVDLAQLLLGHQRVALIPALIGRSVAEEMLGGRADVILVEKGRAAAFEAPHDRARIIGDDARVLRIALIGPTPAIIARHRDRGCESPVHARGAHLGCRRGADTTDQRRIMRGAEPYVVGKQRSAEDIVVAMHRVYRPHQRDADMVRARIDRGLPIGLDHVHPVLDGGVLVALRERAAAILDAADMIVADIVGRDPADFWLERLADLLLQRHLLEDIGDLCLDREIEPDWRTRGRPDLGMDRHGRRLCHGLGGGLGCLRAGAGAAGGDRRDQGQPGNDPRTHDTNPHIILPSQSSGPCSLVMRACLSWR